MGMEKGYYSIKELKHFTSICMQLTLEESFIRQLEPLDGSSFERITAACFWKLGYYVRRNLKYLLEQQEVAEIDVFASLITPLDEIILAIECKGRAPTFKDLRKFFALKNILKSELLKTRLIAYGSNSIREEHFALARKLDIELHRKSDLARIINLANSGPDRQMQLRELNRYVAVFIIQDYLLDQATRATDTNISSLLKAYKHFLFNELWKISDPIIQLDTSFKKMTEVFTDISKTTAEKLGLNLRTELSTATNDVLQAAMFLETLHRSMNTYALLRASVIFRTNSGDVRFRRLTPRLMSSIEALCNFNLEVSKIQSFLERWIFLWGGVLLTSTEFSDIDTNTLSKDTGVVPTQARAILNTIRTLYEGGDGLFFSSPTKIYMKYVPAAFRGLGKRCRMSMESSLYPQGLNIFREYEDGNNYNALSRALISIGGADNLII
jgi:predicted RecB family endonuclease